MKCIKRFFSIPPFENSSFRVRGLGIREPMPRTFVNRPKGTGDYLVMYFHTPVRVGTVETADWAGKGTLYIWEPGAPQFYGNENDGFLHSWIHCDGTVVARAFRSALAPHVPLQVNSPASFEKFLYDLHAEISGNAVPDEIIGENLFENWVRDVRRTLAGSTLRPPERLSRVKQFMDFHFNDPVRLAELAEQANWSVAHFSEEFHRFYGTSPIDYIIAQRMHQAAYLLGDINRSVTEVGQAVGYEDLYYFSKLFKRRFGVSPRNSRKRRVR